MAVKSRHKNNPNAGKVANQKPEAKRLPKRVKSLAAVGVAFSVSERTAATWRARGMPVDLDGHYTISKIKDWLFSQGLGQYTPPAETRGIGSVRERLATIELLDAEYDWRIKSGEFVLAEDVESFFSRVIATARALLDGLADEVASCLPAETATEVAAHVRSRVGAKVVDVYAVLRELTQGDADAAEELADESDETEAAENTET